MGKWIRKGDHVLVIAGNDRGKIGEVLAKKKDRILIRGVNIRKKHMKRTQETQGGRVVEMEVPIHISNVSLCDKDGVRLKLEIREKNDKERHLIYKKEGQELVYRSIKKGKNV